jgi:hypothetical protein
MTLPRPLRASQPVRTSLTISIVLSGMTVALADDDNRDFDRADFRPGNLLLSRVVYDNNSNNIAVGAHLPPNCVGSTCVVATNNGAYPNVWNNNLVDGSFGITAKIVLDQLRPSGAFVNSLEVPNSSQRHVGPDRDQMVTSFSSKSELALDLSTDGWHVTFMGYLAPIDTIDVSNSNTPAVVDPTNPVTGSFFRVVASLDQEGHFRFMKTNAYSGNNGRAAIMNDAGGNRLLYTAGNAGNGGDPQPPLVIAGTGAQIMSEEHRPLAEQVAGLPTPVGSFNITQLGLKADKTGKDTNFRGLTIFNNVIYYTKGSGGNGINTVYFVDTSGVDANGKPQACPTGVGLPNPSAALPTTPIAYNASVLQTQGVVPYNMCILKGLPTATKSKTAFPFGIWFANAKTLYVADEGNGDNSFSSATNSYAGTAAQTTAGLQKWVFDDSSGAWKLAYVLQGGLGLGSPYTVDNYPTGQNPRTGLPWSPATAGLRNVIGQVHRDGTATIWAVTSTVSGNGDQGADPNRLVMITDNVAAKTPASNEAFTAVRSARFGEVLRGISFTPGTDTADIARRDRDDD